MSRLVPDMKKLIPEGAQEHQMPTMGWGRINSHPEMDERFFTIRMFGVRLFVARGRYDGANYSLRHWVQS